MSGQGAFLRTMIPAERSGAPRGPYPERDGFRTLPIHDAAHNRDVETLQRLLAQFWNPDLAGGNYLRTPLHFLCSNSDAADDRVVCFKLLRDAGANLEATNYVGSRPLHYAAEAGDAKLVSLLLEAGVNVDARNNAGCTALHYAARGSEGNTCFADGATDCVKVLLVAGADFDVRSKYHRHDPESGRRPFDLAILQNCTRAWPLFLRAGAELPVKHPDPWRAELSVEHPDPYFVRVRNAGGFKKYAQAHLARVTKTVESLLGLPARPARLVVEFWHHAGYY